MPRIARQDERAGLGIETVGNTHMAAYQAKTALAVLDGIAEGQTLKAVCSQEGMPTRNTIYRWIALYPEFSKAYYAARELSAQSIEEEALDMAKTLKEPNDFTGTKVRAFEVAMSQFRWSAARRDPRRFGQRAEDRIVVPIQINTSLDLGTNAGGQITPDGDNVYSLRTKVADLEDKVDPREDVLALPSPLDTDLQEDDNTPLASSLSDPYGLPLTVAKQRVIPPNEPLAQKERLRKLAKHKSPTQVKRARTYLKNKGIDLKTGRKAL